MVVTANGRKIAVLLPSLNGGGAERVALFLVEVLAEAGYTVELPVAVNQGALVDHPVAIRHRVDLGCANEMLSAAAIARYCRKSRPDLLIAFVHSAKIMAGIARRMQPSIPLALSVHAALDIPRGHRFWVRRWFGHGLERWLYRRVRGCHVVSADLRSQVERHFAIPGDRLSLIYNPLPARGAMPDLPADHVAWFERPVLMTAGRMTAQKDQAALIDAFARAGLAGTARLLILGEGPLEAMLRDRAAALGLHDDVLFGGFVPNVRPYMARASGFLLSSAFEGFAIVLAEALAAGLPVASYACPSGPAEVLEEGRLGRLLPPGDVGGLAQAMRDMMAGALAPAPTTLVATSLERFSERHIAEQYLAFVARCLSREQP